MANSQSLERNVQNGKAARHVRTASDAAITPAIPFAARLTCTIADACGASGLGRTKLYELIGNGTVCTTTVGRRRLVLVSSLLRLLRVEE
jgi:hypothetical protein